MRVTPLYLSVCEGYNRKICDGIPHSTFTQRSGVFGSEVIRRRAGMVPPHGEESEPRNKWILLAGENPRAEETISLTFGVME
jgi:hypothetical protein